MALTACASGEDSHVTLTQTLRWQQEPGTEIQQCHVFKLDNADPVEVDRIGVQFPAGSHHVHIYKSDTPADDGVADCWSGIDWTRWHLVIGAQTMPLDWQLPTGLTVPLAPHQQMLVQVHWLNTTTAPIDGEIDLGFETVDHSDAHVGVVFGINKQTAMQPSEHKVIQQWCAMPHDTKLLALMGHFHGLGQRYSIDTRAEGATSGSKVYEALGEQTFQFKMFDSPSPVPDGEGLQFECDFFNTTGMPITWGADTKRAEHCNMSAYYYPAPDEETSTFCIVEATEVRAVFGPRERVALGSVATYTLDLNEPAPAGGAKIHIVSSDPDALVVPETIDVPAGQVSASFTARALQPGRVTVTATLGGTSKSTVTTIDGLVISEVSTGTSSDDQWIEIANLSNTAIDLSKFSIGAGRTDYMTTRVPLHVTVPAKGCVVVGGPHRVAGQLPYTEAIDFTPDLGVAQSEANGVALFEGPADQIEAQSVPYDALVYGEDNNQLIDWTGELAQVVAAAPANGTYVRTSLQWRTQTVGTPGICEVH